MSPQGLMEWEGEEGLPRVCGPTSCWTVSDGHGPFLKLQVCSSWLKYAGAFAGFCSLEPASLTNFPIASADMLVFVWPKGPGSPWALGPLGFLLPNR